MSNIKYFSEQVRRLLICETKEFLIMLEVKLLNKTAYMVKRSVLLAWLVASCLSLSLCAATNDVSGVITPPPHVPRPLTQTEADELRSANIDPTGMMIDADLPVIRLLTDEELRKLQKEGIDVTPLTGTPVLISSPQEVAAMKELIAKARNGAAPKTPPQVGNDVFWMDSFLGSTNVCIPGKLVSAKKDALTFQTFGKTYEYSGHFTVLLNKPREHKNPYFGFGSPPKAKLVILESLNGATMPLPDATIWEQSGGFINVVSGEKEWIYSGTYTVQN